MCRHLRILFWSLLFTVCSSVLIGCDSPVAPMVPNRQLREIGRLGDGPGRFREPRDIKFTPRNTLLVTDFRNYRIQEVTLKGDPLREWGRKGSGPGQFMDPVSAIMDRNGDLYVVDTWNHRIQKFHNDTGQWEADWATLDFYAPRGITIDNSNRIYVVNTSRHSVAVYEPDGNRLAVWGNGVSDITTFHDPIGIAADDFNRIYVADCGNARIKIMDSSGQVIGIIPVEDWNVDGFIEGYIDVDSSGKIHVTSSHTHKILVYLPDGTLFSRFGKHGGGPELINFPTGLALAPNGQIYISDTMNHRIVMYAEPVPLPNVKLGKTNNKKTISIVRWCIDGLALLIILCWLARKLPVKRFLLPISKTRQFLQTIRNKQTQIFRLLTVALGILILAKILDMTTDLRSLSIGLVALATLVLIFVSGGLPYPPSPITGSSKRSKRFEYILIILILFLSVFFRFHKLNDIPTGINNDAGWNGLYAHRILEGEPYTPFTSEAWGKSTLYFYLIAASFKMFGISKFSLYLPCILASLLTVIAIYMLGRTLWNHHIALLSAAVSGVMAWNITFSRTGYRAILSPLCLVVTGWLFYRAVDNKTWWKKLLLFSGCGMAVGTGLHTYFSFRGIPVMMIAIGIHTWVTTPKFMRKNWWGLLALLGSAWVVFLPLFFYALKDPASFFGRSDFLLITNKIRAAGSLRPVWDNLLNNLQIYHFSANVGNFFDPVFPILSWPVAFFFTVGMASVIWRFKTRSGFWMVMTFCFGMLPGLISQADAARLIMLTIPVALATALGVNILIQAVKAKTGTSPESRIPSIVAVSLVLIFAVCEYHLYFVTLAKSADAQFGYARVHSDLGNKAVELSKDYTVYVINSHFIDTPKFICHTLPNDPFIITGGIEVDFISDEEIYDNLITIKTGLHPHDKGLAFVMDHCEKNMLIMKMLKIMYPNLSQASFGQDDPDEPPEFYTLTIDKQTGK